MPNFAVRDGWEITLADGVVTEKTLLEVYALKDTTLARCYATTVWPWPDKFSTWVVSWNQLQEVSNNKYHDEPMIAAH
jgi:hypothetical protein